MKKNIKNKWLLVPWLILFTGCCTHIITPIEMTHTAITETFVRIDIYAKQNNKIPDNLSTLLKRDNYANRITDNWGQELIYTINNIVISLTSLGKDGVIGGTGDNADISKSYFYKKTDGTLWVGQDLWIVEAEKH